MKSFILELKHAFLSVKGVPGFVAAVTVTLGLTLGALTCIMALNQILFLKPLPYPDQERLVVVNGIFKNNDVPLMSNIQSYKSAESLYEKSAVFEQSAMLKYEVQTIDNLAKQPKVLATFVTSEYFQLTDVRMLKGRAFDNNESAKDAQMSAVISFDAWQQYFAGESDVVGKKLEIGDKSYRVVGVVSEDFSQPAISPDGYGATDIWLPWNFHSGSQEERVDWGSMVFEIQVIGKLATNYSLSQANQLLSEEINQAFTSGIAPPGTSIPYSMAGELVSFETIIIGDSRSTALLMLAAVMTLLLIATSNVINLMLSRTVQKHRQLTIRAIHGANKIHLSLTIFAESLILMTLVTAIALVVGSLGFDALRNMASLDLPRLDELTLNLPLIGFTIVVAILLAIIFTLVSLRTINYQQLQASIKSSGKGSGLQISPKIRNALVASQVALAGLLLAANSSVLKQSTDNIYRSMGFETQGLVLAEVDYKGGSLSPEHITNKKQEILDYLGNQSIIASVSTATVDPTRVGEGGTATENFGDEQGLNMIMSWVSESYFDTVGYTLESGRYFTREEVAQATNVTVISRALADSFFKGEDPIGQKMFHNNSRKPYTVVGVVKSLALPQKATEAIGEELSVNNFFMPGLTTPGIPEWRFQLKLKEGQELTPESLQSLLKQLDSKLGIWIYQSMEDRHVELLARDIMASRITLALAVLSLLLAGVGIFGVLSYGTQLRKYELGVRMSIGATPANIMNMIMLSNARAVAMGAVLSVVLGLVAYSVARQYVEESIQLQVLPLILTFALVFGVSALASWLPIRSILKNWPIVALRT